MWSNAANCIRPALISGLIPASSVGKVCHNVHCTRYCVLSLPPCPRLHNVLLLLSTVLVHLQFGTFLSSLARVHSFPCQSTHYPCACFKGTSKSALLRRNSPTPYMLPPCTLVNSTMLTCGSKNPITILDYSSSPLQIDCHQMVMVSWLSDSHMLPLVCVSCVPCVTPYLNHYSNFLTRFLFEPPFVYILNSNFKAHFPLRVCSF